MGLKELWRSRHVPLGGARTWRLTNVPLEPLPPFVDTRVTRTFETPSGEAKLITAIGYYRGVGIILHLPDGKKFPKKIAEAFVKLTDGQFRMSRVYPGAGTDGLDWGGVALISAGTDYSAYRRGESGYFKESPPPDIDTVTSWLSQLFNTKKSELVTE